MSRFLELKKQLTLLDPFIRLKRIKEILVHVKSKKARKELIDLARIAIYQLNRVREGEERSSLDSKITENISDDKLSAKIERTIEEIAEEESTLIQKSEDQEMKGHDSQKNESPENIYGLNSKTDSDDFYKSTKSDTFYASPEEDKKEKRLYF